MDYPLFPPPAPNSTECFCVPRNDTLEVGALDVGPFNWTGLPLGDCKEVWNFILHTMHSFRSKHDYRLKLAMEWNSGRRRMCEKVGAKCFLDVNSSVFDHLSSLCQPQRNETIALFPVQGKISFYYCGA